MARDDTTHLIEQLISSKLSKEELDEFLAGLKDADVSQVYSDLLEAYFQELVQEQDGVDTKGDEKLLTLINAQKKV